MAWFLKIPTYVLGLVGIAVFYVLHAVCRERVDGAVAAVVVVTLCLGGAARAWSLRSEPRKA